jgi:hypothetical protein
MVLRRLPIDWDPSPIRAPRERRGGGGRKEKGAA